MFKETNNKNQTNSTKETIHEIRVTSNGIEQEIYTLKNRIF